MGLLNDFQENRSNAHKSLHRNYDVIRMKASWIDTGPIKEKIGNGMTLSCKILTVMLFVVTLAGCEMSSKLPFEKGVGADPYLPPPATTLIPTVKVAKAIGWSGTTRPSAPPNFQVTAFARDLAHPRWLYTMPNGDILVAESNKPTRLADSQENDKGFSDWIREKAQSMIMGRAGANAPSANRITLLRGIGPAGTAKLRAVFMKDLLSPFGMVLVGNELYIANANAIIKVPYTDGQTEINAVPIKVTDLPLVLTIIGQRISLPVPMAKNYM